jgi:hypothetical protein
MKSIISIVTLLGISLANPMAIMPLEVIGERHCQSCPPGGTLSPGYLSPTLMVPVSAKLPDERFGSTQVPIITPNDFCTIFNLEIPPSAFDKNCTLEFLFPDHHETSSPYFYNGEGHFTFTGYLIGSGATLDTTYNHQPPAGQNPPSPPAVLSPGHAYIIKVTQCGIPGMMSSLEVSGMLCSDDSTFVYSQSSHTCPIGFYVTIS